MLNTEISLLDAGFVGGWKLKLCVIVLGSSSSVKFHFNNPSTCNQESDGQNWFAKLNRTCSVRLVFYTPWPDLSSNRGSPVVHVRAPQHPSRQVQDGNCVNPRANVYLEN